MDIDHDQNGLVEDIDTEATNELPNSHERHTHPSILYMKKNDIYNIQTPDLNEVFSPNDHVEGPSAAPSQSFVGSIADGVPTPDLAECPHAPPTPGLMEEMFLGNMHEGPALSPQTKPSSSIDEVLKHGNSNLQNGHPDSVTDSGVMPEVTVAPDSANIVQVVVSPTSELAEHKEQITATVETEVECEQKSSSDLQNGYVCSETKDLTVDEQIQDNGEAMPPEAVQIEGLVSSSTSHEESNSKAHLDRSQVDTEVAISNSCGVEGQPSGCCSTEHVEDVNSCLNGDASALSSDLHLRSCTSEINQVKRLSAQDRTLAENICGVSIEEPSVPLQTPGQENKLHDSESSFELQGKDSNGAKTTDADLEGRENPQDVLTGSAVDVSNIDELLVDLSQKDAQKNQLNCSLSSEFPEPEKMLLASTGDIDHANELSQPRDGSSVMNDEAKHFTDNDSTIDLASAGGDSKDRMVDNNALAVADDDIIMHVEEAHASNDASTMDRGMRPPDAITSSDPQDICAVAEANGEALISELDNVNHESEGHLVTDPVPGTDNRIIDEEIVGAKVENEEKLMHNEGNLISDVICSGRLETVSLSPSQTNIESGNVPSAIRENSSFQEFIPDGGIIVESTPMDLATGKECSVRP
ncbi:hypothetical protein BHE74_00014327 [Ensete ventricosum]|nr:hypothetical protein BHE74_00014327 [Ensete ventricosum]